MTTCASKLNDIMTELYDKAEDVEFLMMGIGDLSYDAAPIKASQFESDIRILDQATKIYFEGGGGGNEGECYSLLYYFAARHTSIECFNKRNQKGVIFTIGDEPCVERIPKIHINEVFGESVSL